MFLVILKIQYLVNFVSESYSNGKCSTPDFTMKYSLPHLAEVESSTSMTLFRPLSTGSEYSLKTDGN